jgi:hypothetical protein
VLGYSVLKRKFTKFKIKEKIKDVYFANRESIKIISLRVFNELLESNYTNIQDIIDNPPSFNDELSMRNKIISNLYSLSPIIVLKDIDENANFKLYLDAQTYEDTREILVTFS